MPDIPSQKLRISMHLGAHKTATTHLQHSLDANADLLAQSKVIFRGPLDLRGPKKSLQSRFGLLTNTPPKSKELAEQELWALAGGANRLVLSEENFLGPMWRIKKGRRVPPLYPNSDSQLEKLIPYFGGRPLSLFLAVRNPADLIASAYSQSLVGGKAEPFKDFSEGMTFHDVRWSNVVRRLSLVPEVAEIYVWRYEDYPANFVRIMRKLVGWKLGQFVEPIARRVHSGMSQRAVEKVLQEASPTDSRAQQREMAIAARSLYPTAPENPRYSPWTQNEIELAASAYRSDFEDVSKMEKVKVIGAWQPRK
ncbi:hypothetical protein AB9F26_00675 [Falsihalocynthiibacter sp. BN13B15]|uniref:hypothetical protein n=1 Tax=Falsihalocynthiibacter sp. BN13B15 TaxID=3240871 RepID=UPI0035108BAA